MNQKFFLKSGNFILLKTNEVPQQALNNVDSNNSIA